MARRVPRPPPLATGVADGRRAMARQGAEHRRSWRRRRPRAGSRRRGRFLAAGGELSTLEEEFLDASGAAETRWIWIQRGLIGPDHRPVVMHRRALLGEGGRGGPRPRPTRPRQGRRRSSRTTKPTRRNDPGRTSTWQMADWSIDEAIRLDESEATRPVHSSGWATPGSACGRTSGVRARGETGIPPRRTICFAWGWAARAPSHLPTCSLTRT